MIYFLVGIICFLLGLIVNKPPIKVRKVIKRKKGKEKMISKRVSRHIQGMELSYADIQKILGCSEGTAWAIKKGTYYKEEK